MEAGPLANVEFAVLGQLEVRVDGVSVPVGSARQQTVLAVLLLERGQVVPLDRLITALWDDSPPATARVQAQICVSRLRARLRELAVPATVATRGPGYALEVAPDAVDLSRFRQLALQGRQAADRGDHAKAAEALRAALELWRADALAGLRSRLLQATAVRLNDERLAVTEELIELDVATGRFRHVIGQLRQLIAIHPLRERLYGLLMRALYGDGQQAAALEVYQQARDTLRDELGLDPGEELRGLERAILDGDLPVTTAPDPLTQAPPRQLPAAPPVFVGREETVDQVRRLLTGNGGSEAVVVLITGPPGVGKTALALQTAYAVADQFPDGQLFAYLRGGDARAVASSAVLGHFLRSVGISPGMIPSDEAERAAMYRSQLASRRVLVFLDDAVAAGQIAPLVPGAGGVVVVTSRGALPGLNSHRFDLAVLPGESSRRLLAAVLGDDRVTAEPAEAALLTQACGHLPLALQIAAAKLVSRPHWQLARQARRLSDESRRLDELSLDGAGVRASIAVSYEALPRRAQRLLALLRLVGATDFGTWIGVPLLEVTTDESFDILDELVDARLVEVHTGSGYQTRYRLHDLVRTFARELLTHQLSATARAEAQDRLLRTWLFLARQAHKREYGGEYTVLRAGARDWPLPPDLVDELLAEPLAWLNLERANLVSAVQRAAELGEAALCVDLAVSSVALFENRALLKEWRDSHDLAFTTARQAGDARAEAVIRCSRAGLSLVEQRWDDAVSDFETALVWFDEAGDRHGRGLAQRGLGFVERLHGRTDRARERYEQALADLRQAGDRAAEAGVLTNLGQLRADASDLAESEALLRQAIAISTEIGERRGEAQASYRLGEVLLARGDLVQAESALTAAHALVTATGDLVGIGYALLGLGNVALARDDRPAAASLLTDSLAMARHSGNRMNEARALLALAELDISAGEPSAARRLAEAEVLFQAYGTTRWHDRIAQLRRQLPAG